MYKLMYYYFVDMHREFINLMDFREHVFPNLENIDKTIRLLQTRSNVAMRQKSEIKYDTMKEKFKMGVQKLSNADLYDCIPAINDFDVDYSYLKLFHREKKKHSGERVLNLQLFLPVGMYLMSDVEMVIFK